MQKNINISHWNMCIFTLGNTHQCYCHIGGNVSYPEHSFMLLWWFSYPIRYLNLTVAQSTQTQSVPNGWKFTFSADLLLILIPVLGEWCHHTTSHTRRKPGHHLRRLTHPVSIWTAGEQAQLISPPPGSQTYTFLLFALSPSPSLPTALQLSVSSASICAIAS